MAPEKVLKSILKCITTTNKRNSLNVISVWVDIEEMSFSAVKILFDKEKKKTADNK